MSEVGDSAESELERCVALVLKHSLSTGHAETHEELIKEVLWQLEEFRERARGE